MTYDIFSSTAPAMPKPSKGTEFVKLLLSQASKDMYEPLVPMFFPIFGAHIFGAEFQYPDFSWKEPTGMMTNLVAKSGDNKGQFKDLANAICRDFREHDKAEEDKLLEWQKRKQTESDNKKKTARTPHALRSFGGENIGCRVPVPKRTMARTMRSDKPFMRRFGQ